MSRARLQEPLAKICGIRDPITAQVAVRAGAGALGVMLAPSRRQIQPEDAREIKVAHEVPVVGVVVNETAKSLDDLIERSQIDMVQLSGDETPDLLDHISIPVMKAIRLLPGQTADDAARAIEPWLDHRRPVDAILFDAHVDGHYGGTGLLADWVSAARLSERYPLVLAGGLNAENVGESVHQVVPFGVDVSTGVETDGAKDHQKIIAFITAFRAATHTLAKS